MVELHNDFVRRDMRKLAEIVRELRRTYPRMELGQLHVLMLVLAKPGVRIADLVAATKLTKSAISRNTLALAQQSYLDGADGERAAGLDLLTGTPDPEDARSKLIAPTVKGWLLAEILSGIMRRGN